MCQNLFHFCSMLCFLVIWSQKWRDLSFSVVCAKKVIFAFIAWCDLAKKIYISTCDVSLWDTCIAIWILFSTLLYICGKDEKDKICTFSLNLLQWLKSKSRTSFHISRSIEHSRVQNYSFSENLSVWGGGGKIGSSPMFFTKHFLF